MRRTMTVAVLATTLLLGAAGSAGAAPRSRTRTAVPARAAWSPQAARYGSSEQANVPVTMSDGTVLRADVYTPTDPATGRPAAGTFPVLLQQTPYGKEAMADSYFVQRGFIEVVADVRGSGDSQGSFDLFDPAQASDGAG